MIKTWTETPTGDAWFQTDLVYEYDMPMDIDSVIMYDVTFGHEPEPKLHYATSFAEVETRRVMSIWFAGGDSLPFNCTISLHYNSTEDADEITREPYSGMRPNDAYIQAARRIIIRTKTAWPFCKKCYSDKVINMRTERSLDGNLEVVTFLGCRC
jgi:hypothetical protein